MTSSLGLKMPMMGAGNNCTAANTAADAANDAAARAETAARPTEEMFASVHELLRAGSADAVTGSGDVVNATFLHRASNVEGARDGVATIECIRGNTVRWNQLAQINNSMIAPNSGTKTFDSSTSEWTFTSDGSATSTFGFYTKSPIAIPANHKSLIGVDVKLGASASAIFGHSGDYSSFNVGTTYTRLRKIVSPTEDKLISCYTTGGDGVTMTVKNIQLFDLTQMFGAGNEPATVEEFERLYPEPYYPYDAGTLKPVNMTGIESTGFNLLDPARIAALDSSIVRSGDTFTGTLGAFRSHMAVDWEGIEYFPNTSYEVSLDYTISSPVVNFRLNVLYTDGTFDMSQQKQPGSGKLSMSSDPSKTVKRIMFNYGADGPCVISNFCIHLVQDGTRSGEYEEYWSQLREIDLAKYFPTGLKSAGSKYDALYKDHADTVIGSVDLGTLDWEYSAAATRFLFRSTDLPYKNDWTDVNIRLSTSRYTYGYISNTATPTDDKLIGIYHQYIYIRDLAYTDVAAFKAAISGVILYYELATPIVPPIDPPLNLSYRVDTYGTEEIAVEDGVISAPPVLDIAYGYDAESLRDEALAVIAPVENHRAQTNHAVGSYVIHDATLYKVTRAIAANEEFTVGTNVTATTVMAEVAALNN